MTEGFIGSVLQAFVSREPIKPAVIDRRYRRQKRAISLMQHALTRWATFFCPFGGIHSHVLNPEGEGPVMRLSLTGNECRVLRKLSGCDDRARMFDF